jgi:hypothetical protein
MLILIGIVFLALGLTAGVLLLLPAFGLLADAHWAIWLLFPILTLAGHLLIGLGRKPALTRLASLLAGGAALLLAAAATVVFFLQSAGLMATLGDQSALWVLTGVGFMLGGALYSMGRRIATDATGAAGKA